MTGTLRNIKTIKIFPDSPYPAEVFNALRKIAGLHDDNMSDSDSEPETTTIGRGPLPDLPMEGRPLVEAAGDTARSKPLEPEDIEGKRWGIYKIV